MGVWFQFNSAGISTFILYALHSNMTFDRTHFVQNAALKVSRGMVTVGFSKLKMSNTVFANNTSKYPIILLVQCSLTSYHNFNFTNNRGRVSAFELGSTVANFTGNVFYFNNLGTFHVKESTITFFSLSVFFGCQGESAFTVSFWSKVYFMDRVLFSNNYTPQMGGAISLFSRSQLFISGEVVVFNNTARRSGGGVYLDQSEFICFNRCLLTGNKADKGGGIHAIASTISTGCFNSSLHFTNNEATHYGGGLSLESASKLRSLREVRCTYEVIVIDNIAGVGVDIYVNDWTDTAACSSTFKNQQADCFLHTPFFNNPQWKGSITIGNRNSTVVSVYGGLLDRCVARDSSGVSIGRSQTIGIDLFKYVTKNVNIEEIIASDPVRLCYCSEIETNCSYKPSPRHVRKGEAINVTVIALDQVGHAVNAKVHISIKSKFGHLGRGQRVQNILNNCTNLTLNIFSFDNSARLILYADGPCEQVGISHIQLDVIFDNCTCPPGYHVSGRKNKCQCICDSKVLIHEPICNITSIMRQSNSWVEYIPDAGFLFHTSCPFDYCYPPTQTVIIPLNVPNGSDAQCNFNRTGLLCGSCKSSFSLSLGSSHCIQCPRNWYGTLTTLLMIIAAMLCGIILVFTILILNLTVATGTLNGLIFYANIVAAYKSLFLPFTEPNFVTVLIAWMNLDLGLDVCFFSGMEEYHKAWLQLAFPAYVIVILALMILLSCWSSRFAKFIGKRNPVATLATLILFSYAKLLRAIISIFSNATLKYPEGSPAVVWLPDASVNYIQGKHIPLFLMALVILVMGVAYTILLFSWQWLLKAPNSTALGWTRNTRLTAFMEANLAPFKSEYRYWSGLLLFVRIALYLGIALDHSYEDSSSLLVMVLVIAGIVLLKTILGDSIYKKKILNSIDTLCYVNLLMFGFGHAYCQKNTICQIIFAKISICLTFVLLCCVLFYHMVFTVKEIKCLNDRCILIKQNLLTNQLILKLNKYLRVKVVHFPEAGNGIQANNVLLPTSSVVELRESLLQESL